MYSIDEETIVKLKSGKMYTICDREYTKELLEILKIVWPDDPLSYVDVEELNRALNDNDVMYLYAVNLKQDWVTVVTKQNLGKHSEHLLFLYYSKGMNILEILGINYIDKLFKDIKNTIKEIRDGK